MSYLALARKWRPQQFAEVIGQPHVVQALLNALSQQRMHHAYLFSGTRGVGKTTIARLLAKALNCEQMSEQGGVGEPCGQCQSCIDIQQGRFVDLIEIDAASRTKVEDTREILENVQYRPTRGRYKVYLIDEVHMLSRHSFNALLKTLEEPPPHVKFLLATTDPQKLPVTILSRCLQFNLKSLSVDEIADHLSQVLAQEQISFDADGVRELAVAARGSMRDGLSLTDQAIAYGGGQIQADQVSRMLGTASRSQVVKLLQALFAADQQQVFEQLQQIVAFSPDIDRLLSDLLNVLHQIAMMQFRPAAYAGRTGYEAELLQLSQSLDPQSLQLYYRIVLEGRRELPWSPDTVAAIEMTLLRCLAFYPDDVSRIPATAAEAEPTAASPVQSEVTSPLSQLKQRLAEEPSDSAPAKIPAAPEPAAETAVDSSAQPAPAKATVVAAANQASTPEPKPKPKPVPPALEPAPAADLSMPPAASDDEMARELALQQDRLLSMAESQGFEPVPSEPAYAFEADAQPAAPAQQPAPAESTPAIRTVPQASATDHGSSPQPATTSAVSAPSANVDGVLKARHMLRSLRKQKEGEGGKKPEPAPVARASSPAGATNVATTTVTPAQATASPPGSEAAISPAAPVEQKRAQDSAQAEPVGAPVAPQAENSPAVNPAPERPVPDANTPWFDLVKAAGLSGLLRQLAMHSVGQRKGDAYQLTLLPDQKHLGGERQQQQLAQSLSNLLQHPVSVFISIGEVAGAETPYQRLQREYQERLQQAHAELEADPAVNALKQRFAAEIDLQSVKPL